MQSFDSLSEKEILALAIGQEEQDARIYGDFADGLKEQYPKTAEVFRRMREEEDGHRRRLIELFQQKFGEHIPLVRREDVKGMINRRPFWRVRPLGLETVRREAALMELETRRFYEKAAARTSDASVRQLLGDLAAEERGHESLAGTLEKEVLTPDARAEEAETARRLFVLQVVQPGLAGLMDGSVSTLAPLFAAAFAAAKASGAYGGAYAHWEPFKVGLAASIGAGISMGFAEALSDDGSLTGRGRPILRGLVCGLMTTVGGIGHTMPYLIPHFRTATTVAIVVVAIELVVISWIRHRFMDSPWLGATVQVVLGGVLVFLAGILIGSA
jgi:rubrerythrin